MLNGMEPSPHLEPSHVTAVARAFATTQQLPNAFRNNLHASIVVNHDLKALVMHLSVDIMTHRVATITRRWPMNWKEALKERFAPRWLLARWPVRYTTLTVTADELFPDIAMPKEDWKTIPIRRLTSTESANTGDDTDE